MRGKTGDGKEHHFDDLSSRLASGEETQMTRIRDER